MEETGDKVKHTDLMDYPSYLKTHTTFSPILQTSPQVSKS